MHSDAKDEPETLLTAARTDGEPALGRLLERYRAYLTLPARHRPDLLVFVEADSEPTAELGAGPQVGPSRGM